MFLFLFTFFIDIVTPVISSTHIAYDVICIHIYRNYLEERPNLNERPFRS